jgi:hypothetical protein
MTVLFFDEISLLRCFRTGVTKPATLTGLHVVVDVAAVVVIAVVVIEAELINPPLSMISVCSHDAILAILAHAPELMSQEVTGLFPSD